MKNDDDVQRIDIRTMKPVEEERDKYFQEYEKELKLLQKEQLKKRNEQINKFENPFAKIIKIMAWITLVIGIISSIIVAQANAEYSDFNSAVMIEGWIVSGVATISLLSFAEIIQILHDIRARVYKK